MVISAFTPAKVQVPPSGAPAPGFPSFGFPSLTHRPKICSTSARVIAAQALAPAPGTDVFDAGAWVVETRTSRRNGSTFDIRTFHRDGKQRGLYRYRPQAFIGETFFRSDATILICGLRSPGSRCCRVPSPFPAPPRRLFPFQSL